MLLPYNEEYISLLAYNGRPLHIYQMHKCILGHEVIFSFLLTRKIKFDDIEYIVNKNQEKLHPCQTTTPVK